MAKKKNKGKPVQKDFSNSPFKNLKGLSAFEAPNCEPTSDKTGPQEPEPAQPGSNEEQTSFVAEMAFLGVDPLKEDKQSSVGTAREAERGITPGIKPERDENDLTTFLEAIGSLEKVFKDEWPGDVPDKRAVPRRMKQVERGQLSPEDELDLHGLTVDEATSKVLFFLQNAIYRGFSTVLLITGKGLHSAGDPVLRRATERFLNEKKEQVVEWGVAPRRYGGEGALVVFLRKPGSKTP